MLECTMTSSSSLVLRQFSKGLVLGIVVFCQNASHAQEAVDIVEYFTRAQDARGAGLARKSKPVDVRPARPDEVIVTMIKGEGKETQSPPAKSGDMVVRNRCPETGNEQILVPAAGFLQRYEGPIAAADANGWSPYRPRGVQMRFVVVPEQGGSFNFIAPWGERMIARPGDLIVQIAQGRFTGRPSVIEVRRDLGNGHYWVGGPVATVSDGRFRARLAM